MSFTGRLEEARDLARERRCEDRRRSRLLAAVLLVFFCLGLRAREKGLEAQRRGQIAVWNEARRSPGFIDLNTATEPVLTTLPGVGPATAARIRAWRELVGPFRGPDDLSRVPGIGKNRREQLRGLIKTEFR